MKRAHLLTSMLLAVVLALGMAPSFALAAGAGQTSTSTSASTGTSASTSTSTSSSAGTSAQTSTGQTAAQTPSATTPDQTSQSAVVATTQSAASLATQATPSVSYQAHVQDIGWQSAVSDGAIAGTTGQSKRVEALKISLSSASGSITYQAHVQDIGWQSAVSDGAMAGTTGQSKRVEALKISLSGDVANSYDVYYRVHVENYGWLAWAKDGETAGTSGLCFRIEALQIQLVAKGAAAPDGTGSNALAYVPAATASYSAHVQNVGWQGAVSSGATAGTTGRGLRVEALKAQIASAPVSGGISYSAHVQDVGWQDFVSDGALAGTTGQSKRVEALKVSLTGDLANYFDVYYRVHIENYGWLDWAENGQVAGSTGRGLRVEALQIKLVGKGGEAPGNTVRHEVRTYIYLDAGHGWSGENGYESGACANGYMESQQTAELVDKTANYARSLYGLDVYTNIDCDISYRHRNADAAARGCTALVSIHFNSSGGNGGTGSESYYSSSDGAAGSYTLRNIMHAHLLSGLGLTNRGLKDYGWTVICGSVPATLMEICFIDNSYDMNVYKSREDAVARQLAAGLYEASEAGL